MPTIDWPEALIPQTAQLTLRKAGAQFASPFNGTLQAVDFIGERWTLSASLAQMSARNPRGVGAFCNRLAGGVERVRVWPFHTGGVPRGTLRGAPTVATSAMRGAAALAIAGALSAQNLISGGGFEIDSNSDGMADGWDGLVPLGTAGTFTRLQFLGPIVPGSEGGFYQELRASALNGRMQVSRGLGGITPGEAYTFAADVSCTAGLGLTLTINWLTAGSSFISAVVAGGLPTSAGRRSVTGVAPPTAATAIFAVFVDGSASAPALLNVDNAQFERAAAATPWAGAPSLRAGDFIGAGGQLFQVAADTTLSDAGTGSVPIVNRVRSTIAAGSAVTWYRPTCEMVLPAMQAGPVHRPGVIESTALDLVEVW